MTVNRRNTSLLLTSCTRHTLTQRAPPNPDWLSTGQSLRIRCLETTPPSSHFTHPLPLPCGRLFEPPPSLCALRRRASMLSVMAASVRLVAMFGSVLRLLLVVALSVQSASSAPSSSSSSTGPSSSFVNLTICNWYFNGSFAGLLGVGASSITQSGVLVYDAASTPVSTTTSSGIRSGYRLQQFNGTRTLTQSGLPPLPTQYRRRWPTSVRMAPLATTTCYSWMPHPTYPTTRLAAWERQPTRAVWGSTILPPVAAHRNSRRGARTPSTTPARSTATMLPTNNAVCSECPTAVQCRMRPHPHRRPRLLPRRLVAVRPAVQAVQAVRAAAHRRPAPVPARPPPPPPPPPRRLAAVRPAVRLLFVFFFFQQLVIQQFEQLEKQQLEQLIKQFQQLE